MNKLTNGTIKCVNCHFSAKTITDGDTYQYSINGGSPMTATDGEMVYVTTPYITSTTNMFSSQTNIKEVDLRGFDAENLENMDNMFQGCENLESVNMEGLNLSNVESHENMFDECSTNIIVSIDSNNEGIFENEEIGLIVDGKPRNIWCWNGITTNGYNYTVRPYSNTSISSSLTSGQFYCLTESETSTTMCKQMFYAASIISLDLSKFDTSKVTDMSEMFGGVCGRGGCSPCRVTNLDLNGFDTSKVTNMRYMFHIASSLTSLNVTTFNTSNVVDMYGMFNGCGTLNSLNVNNFDTSNVTNMDGMFINCSSLTTLDLSNFNTNNVTSISQMFYNCSSLKSINVGHFNTIKITSLYYMFYNCPSLTSLDLSNWDTSNVTNMDSMFTNCSSLTTLDLSNFNTNNVTDSTNMRYMFKGCPSMLEITCKSAFRDWCITNASLINLPEPLKDASSLQWHIVD